MSFSYHSFYQRLKIDFKSFPVEIQNSILKCVRFKDSLKLLGASQRLRGHILYNGCFQKHIDHVKIYGCQPKIEDGRLIASDLRVTIFPKPHSPRDEWIEFKTKNLSDQFMQLCLPFYENFQVETTRFHITPNDFALFKKMVSLRKMTISLYDQVDQLELRSSIEYLSESNEEILPFDVLNFIPNPKTIDYFFLRTNGFPVAMAVLKGFQSIVVSDVLLDFSRLDRDSTFDRSIPIEPTTEEVAQLSLKDQFDHCKKIIIWGNLENFSLALSNLHFDRMIHVCKAPQDFEKSADFIIREGIPSANNRSIISLVYKTHKNEYAMNNRIFERVEASSFSTHQVEELEKHTAESSQLFRKFIEDFSLELTRKSKERIILLRKDRFLRLGQYAFKKQISKEMVCYYLLIISCHKDLPLSFCHLYAKKFDF